MALGGIFNVSETIPRSHSQASLQVSMGTGPDEPGQLCTEEMTAWDSFSHP